MKNEEQNCSQIKIDEKHNDALDEEENSFARKNFSVKNTLAIT